MKNRGVTLLETIIYLGLFGVLMSGALVTVYQLLHAGTHTMERIAVQEEGLFINRKLSWAFAGATAVSAPDTKTLLITRPDLGEQSPLTITEQTGALLLARGGAAPVPLTTSELVVSSTSVTVEPAQSGIPALVRVSYAVDGQLFQFMTYLHSL